MAYITKEELTKLDFKELKNYKEKGWDVPVWINNEYSIFVTFEKSEQNTVWNISEVSTFDFMLNLIENIKEAHAEELAGENW